MMEETTETGAKGRERVSKNGEIRESIVCWVSRKEY